MLSRGLRFVRTVAVPLLLAGSLAACAAGRSVIDVPSPVSAAPAQPHAYAKIVAVNDMRQFEATPRDPSTPSLGSADDLKNKSITDRALARKRGAYGNAFGDVVLPEGKTVADLVRAAAQKALQDKGYAVVGSSAPQYASALPLTIDIAEFWGWFTPGFAQVTIEFKSTTQLQGDALVGPGTVTVTAHDSYGGMVITEGDWADLFKKGVADLSNQIAAKIKPAGVAQLSPGAAGS